MLDERQRDFLLALADAQNHEQALSVTRILTRVAWVLAGLAYMVLVILVIVTWLPSLF